jgi:hypothetical protein
MGIGNADQTIPLHGAKIENKMSVPSHNCDGTFGFFINQDGRRCVVRPCSSQAQNQ